MSVQRIPIIAVIGSGQSAHAELSAEVGALIARSGCHLLTGGGQGVMAATSRAFCEVQSRRGLCIGVTPRIGSYKEGTFGHRPPNAWVELPIVTHLLGGGTEGIDSRNPINVLSAAAVVALPGGPGTWAEVRLSRHFCRPILAYLRPTAEDAAPQIGEHPADALGVPVTGDLTEVEVFIRRHTK